MKVLLLTPTPKSIIDAFTLSGVAYTTNKEDSYTHIYSQNDKAMYGLDNAPDLRLTDKEQLAVLAQQAGLPILPQITLTSKEQLLAFDNGPVILKPKVNTGGTAGGSGAISSGQINNTIFYKIFQSPQRLAEILELVSPTIWDNIAEQECVVQKAIQDDDGTSLVLTVLGCVNGLGQLKLLPITPATRCSSKIGNALVEGWFEPNTADVWGVTQQVEKLVQHYSLKNCFVKLQFLWDGNTAYVHDFSYSASVWYFGLFNNARHFVDQIKYIYDLQSDLTAPIDFTVCLKHIDASMTLPNSAVVIQRLQDKVLIACKGANRQEISAKLNG